MSKIDLSPQRLDLRGLPAGDDVALAISFTDSDGNGQDTTGAVLNAQVRDTPSSDTVQITAQVSDVDSANGQWSVLFSGTDTRSVLGTASKYTGVWDLEITLAGQANPRTVLAGRFEIEIDVTRI